jgi:hypothetical protein
LGYNNALSIVTYVPMESIILALPEPTIHELRPVMVRIFPVLFVRVRKCLVSLSIVFVVQLSIRNISSSIGLTCIIYIKQELSLSKWFTTLPPELLQEQSAEVRCWRD